jgi:hypothetical protein
VCLFLLSSGCLLLLCHSAESRWSNIEASSTPEVHQDHGSLFVGNTICVLFDLCQTLSMAEAPKNAQNRVRDAQFSGL